MHYHVIQEPSCPTFLFSFSMARITFMILGTPELETGTESSLNSQGWQSEQTVDLVPYTFISSLLQPSDLPGRKQSEASQFFWGSGLPCCSGVSHVSEMFGVWASLRIIPCVLPSFHDCEDSRTSRSVGSS